MTRLLQLLEEARGVGWGADAAWGRAGGANAHGVGWGIDVTWVERGASVCLDVRALALTFQL